MPDIRRKSAALQRKSYAIILEFQTPLPRIFAASAGPRGSDCANIILDPFAPAKQDLLMIKTITKFGTSCGIISRSDELFRRLA